MVLSAVGHKRCDRQRHYDSIQREITSSVLSTTGRSFIALGTNWQFEKGDRTYYYVERVYFAGSRFFFFGSARSFTLLSREPKATQRRPQRMKYRPHKLHKLRFRRGFPGLVVHPQNGQNGSFQEWMTKKTPSARAKEVVYSYRLHTESSNKNFRFVEETRSSQIVRSRRETKKRKKKIT